MADLLQLAVRAVNRRSPTGYRQCRDLPPAGNRGNLIIPKQKVQNPPQFSGTITPAGVHNVLLRRLGTADWLEKTASDANGYFEFKRIQDERYQYEFMILDIDGTPGKIFKIDFPAYSRYLGNPDVNDSTGLTRI